MKALTLPQKGIFHSEPVTAAPLQWAPSGRYLGVCFCAVASVAGVAFGEDPENSWRCASLLAARGDSTSCRACHSVPPSLAAACSALLVVLPAGALPFLEGSAWLADVGRVDAGGSLGLPFRFSSAPRRPTGFLTACGLCGELPCCWVGSAVVEAMS